MRTPLLAATLTAAALTALAHHPPARAAEAAHKPPDPVTIGAVAHPDRTPAVSRATLLTRVPDAPRAESVTRAPADKAESFGVQLPYDRASLSAEQQRKLAAGGTSPSIESLAIPGGKPALVSTVRPPAADARVLSNPERTALKLESLSSDGPESRRLHAGNPTAALGPIPRPEWSANPAPKPADVTTLGAPVPGATRAAGPGAIELQRRATTAVTSSGAAKAPKATTSTPRDPSRGPAPSQKSRPVVNQEARP